MFCASFSGDTRRTGLIPLFRHLKTARGAVNAIRILETYQRYLPVLISDPHEAIFMHDGASTHTANIVRDWLREQRFEVMEWPPYSPDLNPIEHLWSLLKDKVLELFPELYTMPNNDDTRWYLIGCAQQEWSAIDPQILRNLCDSMSRRVQAILEAEGWYSAPYTTY